MLVFSKVDDGYQYSIILVESKGSLLTGAVSGDFTVTVVNPQDTATTTPTVTETTSKPGLYTFLVPSSFLTTHGVGVYRIVVEVAKLTPPKIDDAMHAHLQVSVDDFDTIGGNTVLIPALL